MILNWYRRLSTLWPDLLIGERPDIRVDEDNQPEFNQLLVDSSFWPEIYKALIDTSRFGIGVVNYPPINWRAWFPSVLGLVAPQKSGHDRPRID